MGDIGGAVKDMPTLVLGRALVTAPLVGLTNQLDIRLHGVDPWKVVAGTAGATLLLAYLYNLTQQRVPLSSKVKKYIFKMLRKVPAVRRQIETEMEKMKVSFEKSIRSQLREYLTCIHFPMKDCLTIRYLMKQNFI